MSDIIIKNLREMRGCPGLYGKKAQYALNLLELSKLSEAERYALALVELSGAIAADMSFYWSTLLKDAMREISVALYEIVKEN